MKKVCENACKNKKKCLPLQCANEKISTPLFDILNTHIIFSFYAFFGQGV